MLFIDGTWLYSNTPRLVEASGEPGFALDFGKLPRVLADEVARAMGHDEYTVVRTHLFGSYADNVDPRDAEPVQRRLNFFSQLRQQHHYEIEAFPMPPSVTSPSIWAPPYLVVSTAEPSV